MNDQLEFKKGGGLLTIFGVPFLLAGVGVLVAGMSGSMTTDSGTPLSLWFVIPFGLVFVLIGGGMVFWRGGLVLDRKSRTVTKWSGLLSQMWSKSFDLDENSFVTITKEVRQADKTTYVVYPVRIETGGEKIHIEEPTDYTKSRKKAEEVANFMELGVRDSSSGDLVEREAGTLDEPLRDRLRREKETLEVPTQPPGSGVVADVQDNEVTFEIPPPGLGGRHYLLLAVLLSCIPVPLVVLLLNSPWQKSRMPRSSELWYTSGRVAIQGAATKATLKGH